MEESAVRFATIACNYVVNTVIVTETVASTRAVL